MSVAINVDPRHQVDERDHQYRSVPPIAWTWLPMLIRTTNWMKLAFNIDPRHPWNEPQVLYVLFYQGSHTNKAEKRQAEASRIKQRFKDRVPVICEKVENSDIPAIDKHKYLVPSDLSVGQFVYVIRKRIKLPSEKAIFIFVNDILPPTAALISTIYEEHKDEDGFLYVLYSGENTFGGEYTKLDLSSIDFDNLEEDLKSYTD